GAYTGRNGGCTATGRDRGAGPQRRPGGALRRVQRTPAPPHAGVASRRAREGVAGRGRQSEHLHHRGPRRRGRQEGIRAASARAGRATEATPAATPRRLLPSLLVANLLVVGAVGIVALVLLFQTLL